MLRPFIPPHPDWSGDRDHAPLAADVGRDGTVHALHHSGEADDADGGPAVYLGRWIVPGTPGAVVVHHEAAQRWGVSGMRGAAAWALAAELVAAAQFVADAGA